jgi:hypothetical protein
MEKEEYTTVERAAHLTISARSPLILHAQVVIHWHAAVQCCAYVSDIPLKLRTRKHFVSQHGRTEQLQLRLYVGWTFS